MPLIQAQDTAVLIELGFTISEAKVYLTLNQTGTSGIRSIAKATGIHREHLYQIVNSLEKESLIEKEVGSPTLYRAIPLEEALPMLIKQKQAQIKELKTKTETIVKDAKNKKQNNAPPTANKETENHQFSIVPGKEIIINKLRENIQKTQTSAEIVTTPARFSSAVQEFANDYKQALSRGVKIRIAVEKHAPEKEALKIVRTLTKNPGFEVKFFSGSADAIVSIFDRKLAFVNLSATANLESVSSLCSTNPSFIALAQNFFEHKWNNSNPTEK